MGGEHHPLEGVALCTYFFPTPTKKFCMKPWSIYHTCTYVCATSHNLGTQLMSLLCPSDVPDEETESPAGGQLHREDILDMEGGGGGVQTMIQTGRQLH